MIQNVAVDDVSHPSWPAWPQTASNADSYVTQAIASHRWAISSPRGPSGLWERKVARKFGEYLGAEFVVPVDHGSSALTISVEALGLKRGSLVAVPALTWVATASAVLRAGCVPVLVDVDPVDGCATADSVAAYEPIDRKFSALLPVHYSSAMVDVPELQARFPGVPVIEDCAQAHGAAWQGRIAGTLGAMGCFSMQNQKVLTCGEGGAVVTNDVALNQRLQELRADGRSYGEAPDTAGALELVESASVMGHNYCLSELQSALLLAQLEELDELNRKRYEGLSVFRAELAASESVRVFKPKVQQTAESIYEVTLEFSGEAHVSDTFADDLSARTGVRFHTVQDPLNRNTLLDPSSREGLADLAHEFNAINGRRDFPNAEKIAAKSLQFHHSTLLAEPDALHWFAREVQAAAESR